MGERLWSEDDEAGPRGLARSSRILDEEHEEHETKSGDAEAKLNTNHGKDHAVDAHKHDTNRCSHRRPPIRFDPSQRSRQERSFDPNRRRGYDLGRFFLVAVTQSQGSCTTHEITQREVGSLLKGGETRRT